MATVTVPAEFFRGELRLYNDWREGFMRELLQNATDAHPTRVDVTIEDHDGRVRVTFADDGDGMSRDVLEGVFFALGRTTKTGPDSIGGFGRARIILCFAQERYAIHTGNLLAEGSGAQYTLREVPDHHRGTRLVIDTLDTDQRRLRYALTDLVASSSLKLPVYLDGQRLVGDEMPGRANRVMRDDDGQVWARVYASDGHGRVRCRVHGLVMFDGWLSSSDNIIVEIEPSRSREVLSAARDALVSPFREQIAQFVSKLVTNRSAALREQVAPLNTRVGGGGFLVTDAQVLPDGDLLGDSAGFGRDVPNDADSERVPVTAANSAAAEHLRALHVEGLAFSGDSLFDVPVQPERSLGFDVFLLAERNDARVRKLARRWDPTFWGPATPKNRRALLVAWKAAVGFVLDELLQRPAAAGLGRVLWTVGWTFDLDTQAEHQNVDDGHVIALNPVDEDGTIAFRLSSRSDRQRLLAAAAHEVTHIVHADHTEAFAGALTDLFGAVDVSAGDRAIRRAVRAA